MLFAGVCDYEKSTGTIRCYRYPLVGRGVIDISVNSYTAFTIAAISNRPNLECPCDVPHGGAWLARNIYIFFGKRI